MHGEAATSRAVRLLFKEVRKLTDNRDFKGVWIPKVVWLDSRLNALEKIILTEIDSLDSSERGCWASNQHIAEFCQCSESKVSKAISKLTDLGYIYLQSFDGRNRELKSSLSNFNKQSSKKCEAEKHNLRQSNTDKNTFNNTVIKKERKSSYNAILEKIENGSLRELYFEYIKMRKMIKSPMTDKALQMLINKVEKLEPTDIERQKKLLEASIMNNWKSVYPLKDENAKTPKRQEPKPKWFKQEPSSFDIDEFDKDTLGAYITEKPNEQELAKRNQELKERLKNKYGKERKEAQI